MTFQEFIEKEQTEGHWTKHKDLEDWQAEVANDYTRLGFWEWLYERRAT